VGKRIPGPVVTRELPRKTVSSQFLRRLPALPLFLCLGAIIVGVPSLWWLCHRDNAIPFLPATSSVDWILYPKSASALGHFNTPLSTEFKRSWQVERLPSNATLSVKAFKSASIQINGQVLPFLPDHDWKKGIAVDITKLLKSGENQISVVVSNATGPPALWLRIAADTFSLRADSTWQSSLVGAAWVNAMSAAAPPPIRPGNPLYERGSFRDSLRRQWPAFLAICLLSAVLVWAFHLARNSNGTPGTALSRHQPWFVLAILLIAWLMLIAHNLPLLPVTLGFDQAGHLEYIRAILKNKALPLADEGWQMYQPPLYYALSAGLIAPFIPTASADTCIWILRCFSGFTGLMHLLLLFLCFRLIFRYRPRVQCVALAFAGLLPANLYLAHYVTNESLAALLVTASFYFALRAARSDQNHFALLVAAGLSLGLALLTKFSALLAIPFVAFTAADFRCFSIFPPLDKPKNSGTKDHFRFGPRGARCQLSSIGILLICMLAVCGWHYARVWHRFGKPIVGNWDPVLARGWWQEPGFHTAAWYEHLGEAFRRPLFSAFWSFVDGFYSSLWGDGLCGGSGDLHVRPPWNYDLMNFAFLLGAFGTVLLLVGCAAAAFRRPAKNRLSKLLLFGFLLTMGLALFYMTLRVPSYAQAKAFYALPALLAFSSLIAAGWDFLASCICQARFPLQFLLLVWAVTVYCSFWIQSGAPDTSLARGYSLASQGRYPEAANAFSQGLQRAPDSIRAHIGLADALDRAGQREAGRLQAAETLRRWPSDPEVQLQAAHSLTADNRFADAAALLQSAILALPDNSSAYETLATCLLRIQQFQPALEVCQQGLRVNPFSPELHYFLAAAFTETGDATNAARHLQYFQQFKH
jgi:tetratricopeptide (TPR) repeat protein